MIKIKCAGTFYSQFSNKDKLNQLSIKYNSNDNSSITT